MKIGSFRLYAIIVLFFVLSFVSCTQVPAPGKIDWPRDPATVSFQSTAPLFGRPPLTLTGRLKKPDGAGPFPAVVLLHGCEGILPDRDYRWAERLSGWGYVTLEVDSFRPRGVSSVCTYSGYDAALIMEKRATDAYDAKRYLAGLPFIDRKRIAVLGWSEGGLVTLDALYEETEEPFRAAVAFYPSCPWALVGLDAPLLILIGKVDDWASAVRCAKMMPKRQAALPVTLKVYPGAYHGFDIPGVYADVRGAEGMHHLQYDPEAEADSIIRVKAFFEKYLK
jgi:dienelactone hydrolase